MDREFVINKEQRIFCSKSSAGISTYGFDHVYDMVKFLSANVAVDVGTIREKDIGTEKQFRQMEKLFEWMTSEEAEVLPTFYQDGTPDKVKTILEKHCRKGTRIRVFLGDPDTGEDALEEFGVYGTIGRTMGPIKIVILGGNPIETRRVVKIVNVDTGSVLYSHPDYHLPTPIVVQESGQRKWPYALIVKGMIRARFKNVGNVLRYLSFLNGDTHVREE
jgi:hypothetical protein